MNVIIPNPKEFEHLKTEFRKSGAEKIHILSDFDRTLTYGTFEGGKASSLMSILRNGDYLKEGYAEKAHALFDKYRPIETDPGISVEEKKRLMQEWWKAHYRLLIESGLSKSDLESVAEKIYVRIREGVSEFLDIIHEKNIPLVIFSASGCGEVIPMLFRKMGKDYPNIFYVINIFNWDEEGKAVSVREPIIHSMNKDETVLKKFPSIFNSIKNRDNVVLLGDNVGDLGMIKGFDCENLLKIGFYNFPQEEPRHDYEEGFDVVLEGDGDFSFVSSLLRELTK